MEKDHKPVIRVQEGKSKGQNCLLRLSALIVNNKTLFNNPELIRDLKDLALMHNGVLIQSRPLLAWNEKELEEELYLRKRGTSGKFKEPKEDYKTVKL